jgi:hypothetical protein
LNILKIPTRREPVQIEHKIREEFERQRVVHVLQETSDFLRKLEDPKSLALSQTIVGDVTILRKKVDALISEILAFKT